MALRPRFRILVCSLAAALACLGPVAAAGAHEIGTAAGSNVPDSVQDAVGGEVSTLPDDLYLVDPRHGPSLVTHGPDTPADIRLDHGNSLGPGDPERPPVCATDYYQQVLYAHRASDPDRSATVAAQIRSSVRRTDAVLNEEALDAGGVNADYKVHCDGGGAIDVQSFPVASNGTSFSAVVSAARAAGYDASNVDYTIFFDYDAPNVCGVGSFSSDDRLVADNANNSGGDYGVTYSDCWDGGTAMHENGHNEGAVQYGAPYSTGSGAHCWDENDVMCYSPDGGDIHQQGTINRCTDRLHFDCGNDDYFDPAPEPCEYLASHWNIGSPLNRFIAFGPGVTETPPCPSLPPEPPPQQGGDPPMPDPGAGAGDGGGSEQGSSGAQLLTNRRPLADSSAAAGGWRLYAITVPRHRSRLTVTLRCPGCADELDLYAREGSDPTLTEFACRSAGPGSNESCRVLAPRRGTWHLGVYTTSGAGGAPFEIRARHRR